MSRLARPAGALALALGLTAALAMPANALVAAVQDQSVNGVNRTTTTGNPATPSGGTGGNNYCQNVITPFGGDANNSSPTGFSGGGISWTISKNDGVPATGTGQSDYAYNKNGVTPSGTQGGVTNFYQLGMDPTAISNTSSPSATAGQYEDVTLTADQPVASLSFTLLDVDIRDRSDTGNYRDVAGVIGFNGTTPVTPVATRVGSTLRAGTPSTQGEVVYEGTDNVAATSQAANFTVTFPSPVTSVRIRYSSGALPIQPGGAGYPDGGDGSNNAPTKQLIGISPFQYCGDAIGAAKSVDTPVRNGAAYTVNYTFTAENTGGGVLVSPQIVDNAPSANSATGTPTANDGLPAEYGSYVAGTPTAPGTYTVGTPTITENTATPVAINPNFTGVSPDNGLLQTGTGGIGIDERVRVTVPVTFVPTAAQQTALANGTSQTYRDYVRATANGVNGPATAGTPDVSDNSVDGNDVDANGDGRASDDTSPTPVTIVRSPGVSLAKAYAGTYTDADNNNRVSVGDTLNYTFTVTNTGNVPLSAVTIGDAKIPAANITCTPVTSATNPLAVDASRTCTGSYVVTTADASATQVVNNATVTATAGTGTSAVTTTSTRTPDVIVPVPAAAPPTASPDTSTGAQNAPQSVNPLTNDTPGGSPLAPATLTYLNGQGDPVSEITVNGVGKYTIDKTTPTAPRLVFTPEPGYTGTPAAVPYRISDTEGQTARSTYTPTVTPVTPTATADTSTGLQGAIQRVTPLGNDTAGSTAAPLVPSSLTYLDANNTPVTTLTVPNQGTYTLSRTDPANPQFVFTPLPGFTGQATPVPYRVSDSNGTPARSTYTPTVTAVTPTASPDTSTGLQNQVQRVNPLTNDAPGDPAVPLDPSTLTLLSTTGVPVTTLDVPDQGRYTIDRTTPTAPQLVFTPLSTFTGTATPVDYRISDANGTPAQSTYTPSVTGVTPVARPDTSTGPQNTAQSVAPLANDSAADPTVPLVPVTLTYLDGAGTPVTSLTVPGEGAYTIDRADPLAPRFVFTPEATFTGTATPVNYRISDANGTPARSTYTPSVGSVIPAATPDTTTGVQGAVQRDTPLANDTPGNDTTPLRPATLTFLDNTGAPVDTITTPGEGTYTIDRTNPDTPQFVFTPVASFVGTATPVNYRISDSNGTSASTTYTPTVTGVVPTATPDTTSGPQGVAQSIAPLANDSAGDPSVPLRPATLTYLDSTGAPVDSITVPGQGKYTIDTSTAATPRFVFTPEPQFTGTATPAPYRINDANGTAAQSTYTPTLTPVTPTASPDTSSGLQGAVQRTSPLANDAPGNTTTPLVPSTLRLVDENGSPVTELTVPNEGTYTIDRTTPSTPQLVFTPLPNFVGTATPAPYRIADSNGTVAQSTYTPTLTPVTPTASPDTTSGLQGQVQRDTPLGNDSAGDASVPLVPDTLTYLDDQGNPVDTVTVADEGTYTIDRSTPATPRFVFTPLREFVGEATPVPYQIADSNGTPAQSTYTPTVVGVTPTARPDASSGPQGEQQQVTPLSNDSAGDSGVPLVPATLTYLDGNGNPVDTVTVPGEGSYSIDRTTPGTPQFVFVPEADFTGTATPVPYRISDTNGTPAQSTYTPEVTPTGTPAASPDETSGPQGVVQRTTPLSNDTAGSDDQPLVPATLTYLDATGNPVATITVPGQGVYSISRTDPAAPQFVFTPEKQFVGTATPAPYRISDSAGKTATSTYTPTLIGVTPTANPDQTSGPQGVAQRINPLTNDRAGATNVPLVPSTVTYLTAAGTPTDTVVVADQGTYTIDRSNPNVPLFVFTPLPAFTGTATPAPYRISDTNGTPATSTYTPTLTPVAPTAADDSTSGPQGVAQTINPLTNDKAGSPAVPLDPTTLTYLGATGQPVDTITVAGEGVWTIDRANPQVPLFVFTPEPQFTGPATGAPYRIADTDGTPAQAVYTPRVTPVTPVANPDTSIGAPNTPQSVNPLSNDKPGNADVPLVPSTLTLVDGPGGDPIDSYDIPDVGTYTIDRSTPSAPRIVFTPVDGYVGTPPTAYYEVADRNGTPAESTYNPLVQIGVSAIETTKQVTAGPTLNDDGSNSLSYGVEVANAGTTVLTDVQLTDDLRKTFGSSATITVTGISSDSLAVNPSYDGTSDTDLLAGTDSLQPNTGGKVVLSLRVSAGTDGQTYLNTAVGSGLDSNGKRVSDDSDSGTMGCGNLCDNINPNDDHPGAPGDKGTPNDPTPVTFVRVPTNPTSPTPTPVPAPAPAPAPGNPGLAATGATVGLGVALLAGLGLIVGGAITLRRRGLHK